VEGEILRDCRWPLLLVGKEDDAGDVKKTKGKERKDLVTWPGGKEMIMFATAGIS